MKVFASDKFFVLDEKYFVRAEEQDSSLESSYFYCNYSVELTIYPTVQQHNQLMSRVRSHTKMWLTIELTTTKEG